MENFITQLKRRQVFKVATIYAVSAWPLIQIADLSVPALGLPDSVMTLLLKIFIAGFPVSLIFAWLFNVTTKGIVRATAKTDEEIREPQANVQTTIAVAGSLSLVLLITLASQLVMDDVQSVTANNELVNPVAARRSSSVLADNGKESIAILPFVPFSNDPEDEFFADGMVEELLNLLAKLPQLQVAARTSSFAYKGVSNKTIPEIGQELGVNTILEGSIRKNDTTNKIRVTAQLVRVSTGEHLWSETYDREYQDIFKIQDDIARAVVDKMKITLLGSEPMESQFVAPTTSIDAMIAYGKGQKELGHRTVMSISKALEHFEQAIELDSQYARAYVGIADANNLLAVYGNVPLNQARDAAQVAIDQALAIDDKLAEAYASQGFSLSTVDIEQASAAFKKAIELNPSYAMAYVWYGTMMQSIGDTDKAHNLLEKAFELDPKSPITAYLLANSYYESGDEAKTMELFSHIIANDPYYPDAYNMVGQILLKRGRLDESITMFKRALDVDALNKGAVGGLLAATMDLGSFEQTEQWFKYAQRHDELFPTAESNMWQFRYQLSQGERHKAFDYLSQVKFDDRHADRLNEFISAQRAYYQGDFHTAMQSFEQVRHQNQKNEEAFYRMNGGRAATQLAHAYAQLEMTDKANELLSSFERYLARDKDKQKNNASYYYNMALIKAVQNNDNEALYYLQGAIDVGWVRAWEAEIEPIMASISENIQFSMMMGGVKARLATMRTRMADEDAFSSADFEEI